MTHRPTRVLITGACGFTGRYLTNQLAAAGYEVYGLVHRQAQGEREIQCDITCRQPLLEALRTVRPDYIVHLAAISFVPHGNSTEIYQINLFGTLNLLNAVLETDLQPHKILIASSANVYGNPTVKIIEETVCPAPVSHYANSKLAMEHMARTYFDRLRIIITRPFNYTGAGQAEHFLIPKIIKHFKDKCESIELGNTDVVRDFSDVRFVVKAYQQLLESEAQGEIVNICSGEVVKLTQIIELMNGLAGYRIKVKANPDYIRPNEVKRLIGSNAKLFSFIGEQPTYPIRDILLAMYYA